MLDSSNGFNRAVGTIFVVVACLHNAAMRFTVRDTSIRGKKELCRKDRAEKAICEGSGGLQQRHHITRPALSPV
jgi:hypothetical protein